MKIRASWMLATLALWSALLATPMALGTISYYRNAPQPALQAATTYVSAQRSDWLANLVHNFDSVNIYARWWMYNPVTNTYILQSPDTLIKPTQAKGDNYPSQQPSKNYCRRTSGGPDTYGECYATY